MAYVAQIRYFDAELRTMGNRLRHDYLQTNVIAHPAFSNHMVAGHIYGDKSRFSAPLRSKELCYTPASSSVYASAFASACRSSLM